MEMKQLIINHFSHRHPLELLDEVQEEDEVICSGCEHGLSGLAYICTKPGCNFVLHDFCIELPRQIRHRSHPKHPLTLHFLPPYSDGEFSCDACANSGHAFTYHCRTCKFDLHVECASLPEIEHREDHEHPLSLFFSIPDYNNKGEMGADLFCNVCHFPLAKNCWAYVCSTCINHGTHLECVGGNQEKSPRS